MHLVRLLCAIFSLSLRRNLVHRVNLAFDIGQTLVGMSTILATTMAIFHQTRTLAGWSKSEALVLVGVYAVISGVRAAFIDPNLSTFVGMIRDGSMDEALLRPAPSWFTTTCREHAPLALGQSVLGFGILMVGVLGLPAPPRPMNVMLAVALACCAVAITWAISLMVACLGFWAGRLEFAPLTGSLWDIGRYPADVYRNPLRSVVTYVIPLAGMITLPATALTGTTSVVALVVSGSTAALFVTVAVLFFRKGLKRYTGATS